MEAEKQIVRVDIAVPRELHRRVRRAAFDAEVPMSEWIRQAMMEKLERMAKG